MGKPKCTLNRSIDGFTVKQRSKDGYFCVSDFPPPPSDKPTFFNTSLYRWLFKIQPKKNGKMVRKARPYNKQGDLLKQQWVHRELFPFWLNHYFPQYHRYARMWAQDNALFLFWRGKEEFNRSVAFFEVMGAESAGVAMSVRLREHLNFFSDDRWYEASARILLFRYLAYFNLNAVLYHEGTHDYNGAIERAIKATATENHLYMGKGLLAPRHPDRIAAFEKACKWTRLVTQSPAVKSAVPSPHDPPEGYRMQFVGESLAAVSLTDSADVLQFRDGDWHPRT